LPVVPKWQPQTLELPHLFAVLAMPQVDDMRNTKRLEFLYVLPGGYGATKPQPLAYPKHLHAGTPFCAYLTRLQNMCFTNAVPSPIGPAKQATCRTPASRVL
jgi:hypothetical protein